MAQTPVFTFGDLRIEAGLTALKREKIYGWAETRYTDGQGEDCSFVTSIRSLAREMGIAVVAEYVESAEVLAELEKMDTHLAQGYYIGRPAAQILPEAWSAPEGN